MKVLFLSTDTSVIGGIQRYNKTFIRVLSDSGVEVCLVEIKKGNSLKKLSFIFKVFARSILFRPNLVICGHINFASIAFGLKKLFKIPYIVTLFGIEARSPDLVKKLYLLRAANILCTVSSYTSEKILEAQPTLSKKIFFLENPIDGDVFRPRKPNAELIDKYSGHGKKIILTVARLSAKEKYKGYDKVLESLQFIKDSIPDFLYIIVGGGDDRGRVEELIRSFGLEKSVILAGEVSEEELIDHYNIADVFIMPSALEGFGFVFLEALACGIPTIAGNMDGSAHALLEGELGLLVDPRNTEEISQALKKMISREVPAELLDRDFLREKVLAAYGISKFREKVRKLINEV